MADVLYHLWIPDGEVETREKKLMNPTPDPGLDYSQHGASLSSGLQSIIKAYENLESDSLSDEDIVIFKAIIPEDSDVYSQRANLEKEGLTINAVKNKRQAVVSASKSNFQRLQDRVGTYKQSGQLKHFQFFDSFGPLEEGDKQAASLKKFLEEMKDQLTIDVQMMFVPNMPEDIQQRAVERLSAEIDVADGPDKHPKVYALADGTAVIRADIPVKDLKRFTKDPAIYRVEQTGFFQLSPSAVTSLDGVDMQLDPSINIDTLPTVVVLDSGVQFPDEYERLVPVHWAATGVSGQGSPHGTCVASKVVFSHIGLQLTDPYLKPRAKVIDCDIYGADKDVSQEDMAKRIEEAVEAFHDVAKIYNLSSNVNQPIEGDTISILGYHLDSLMRRYKVKFVISAGNHKLAATCSTLEEMLDDDDARIAEPADAMLGITVGAVAGADGPDVFSARGLPTAYTRIGPGFAGFYKPDLVAYAGNLRRDCTVARDPFSFLMGPGGKLCLDIGTSFSAPVVAGDLAEVAAAIPGEDILMAEALLYNGAEKIWDTKKVKKDEAIYIGNQYGRGLSVPEKCKYSSPYRVSFIRSGSLKKKNKERVRFLMPTLQESAKGNNNTMVTVTCITDSPIDQSKGDQYLGACITATLHKSSDSPAVPTVSDNKEKWDTCVHFSKPFSRFSGGFWEVWLDLFTKWEVDDDLEIPYYLVITIEDLTQTNNIYEAIIQESAGRFRPIQSIRIPVTS